MVAGCCVPPDSPLLYVTSFCGKDAKVKKKKLEKEEFLWNDLEKDGLPGIGNRQ